MSVLVTVDQFREWAGVSSGSVSDEIIQVCLDDAEAGLLADLGLVDTSTIEAFPAAVAVAFPDLLRRAQRGLARRNSPESMMGSGELGFFPVPARDPDSAQSVWRLMQILGIGIPIA